MPKADLHQGGKRGGGRKGGALSMRKALRLAKKAGITVTEKSGLTVLRAPDGDRITVSSRDKEVTKNTAAWLRTHGVEA